VHVDFIIIFTAAVRGNFGYNAKKNIARELNTFVSDRCAHAACRFQGDPPAPFVQETRIRMSAVRYPVKAAEALRPERNESVDECAVRDVHGFQRFRSRLREGSGRRKPRRL
jgi:hypothetical protein